jgi:hypothetical protein
MFNTIVGAGVVGAVGAGAASRYGSGSGSGSDQKMRLLAAPAPQHWFRKLTSCIVTVKYRIIYGKYSQ